MFKVHKSPISAFIFFTLEQSGLIVIRFFEGIVKYNCTHEKKPEWPLTDELMWKVWVGDDCLRRFLFSPCTHIHFAHTVLGSCSSKSGHIGCQCEGNRSPSTALQYCFIKFAEVQFNMFCRSVSRRETIKNIAYVVAPLLRMSTMSAVWLPGILSISLFQIPSAASEKVHSQCFHLNGNWMFNRKKKKKSHPIPAF